VNVQKYLQILKACLPVWPKVFLWLAKQSSNHINQFLAVTLR